MMLSPLHWGSRAGEEQSTHLAPLALYLLAPGYTTENRASVFGQSMFCLMGAGFQKRKI